MSKDFEILRFEKYLIPEIQKLSFIVFKKWINKDYYLTHFGESNNYLGFVAYEDGKAVAFLGAIRVNINNGSQEVSCAQPVNLMVHPDYRQRNYFLLLYNKLVELSVSEGIVMFFGWPNSEILFHKLLRWKKICSMQKIVMPVSTIPLGKVFYKLRPLFPFYKFLVNQLLKKLRAEYTLAEYVKLNADTYPRIDRTIPYMEQKIKLGAQMIKLYGKNILINFDFRLKIGDIEKCSPHELDKIIKKLKWIAGIVGLTEIVMYINPLIPRQQEIISYYAGKEDLVLMAKMLNESATMDYLSLTYTDFDTF